MAIETVSFTEIGNGWDTFHSFIPDWMVHLNNSLYTFENGDIYQHHTNSSRNNYYGVSYPSTITPVFNQDPTTIKMFKTIALEGDSKWKADIVTDLTSGVVETGYYKEKEGDQHAFIRRNPDTIDISELSTQGIGELLSFSTLVLAFNFNIAPAIADGDKVYIANSSPLLLIGTITAHTATAITVDAAANTPIATDFIVVVKASTAESSGARGYFMEVKLTNSETTEVELFSVSSEAFESKP